MSSQSDLPASDLTTSTSSTTTMSDSSSSSSSSSSTTTTSAETSTTITTTTSTTTTTSPTTTSSTTSSPTTTTQPPPITTSSTTTSPTTASTTSSQTSVTNTDTIDSTTSEQDTFTEPTPTTTPSPSPTHTRSITTFSSVIFITTTDSRGFTVSTAPPTITSTYISTGTNGILITVTETVVNPTLLPNNSRSNDKGFFGNSGAVAAVFVLVGLAVASIALWVIFALRRRQRQRRVERDTAISASLAAAGFNFNRSPLDDDDDPHPPRASVSMLEMGNHRSSSGFASTLPRMSYHDDPDLPEAFNPYAEYVQPAPMASVVSKEDYAARASSPPVAFFNNNGNSHDPSRRQSRSGSLGSASGPEGYVIGHNHSASHSGTSYEPLLAAYHRHSSGQSISALTIPPTAVIPPQIPPAHTSSHGHGYSPVDLLVYESDPEEQATSIPEASDDRLDPGLRQRQQEAESASMRDLRDDQDYSRPVLGVRESRPAEAWWN